MNCSICNLPTGNLVGSVLPQCQCGWKAPTPPITEKKKDEPVALVTGVYGGRFTYAPIKASVILPVGMALYTRPQHREWIDLNGEELEILLRENSSLTLGAIWAVADKLKKKNT